MARPRLFCVILAVEKESVERDQLTKGTDAVKSEPS